MLGRSHTLTQRGKHGYRGSQDDMSSTKSLDDTPITVTLMITPQIVLRR
jgi:hypothetical protein